MIVDASLVIDTVADSGWRGRVARTALAAVPAFEPVVAPGHFAFEVMSGLRAEANRPGHPLTDDEVNRALGDAQNLQIDIESTPWSDVLRAWELAQQPLCYADIIYVAAAERHQTALMTADSRIERSGAAIRCKVITIR
ncbi:MAG: type II toxin-antitoxin system VapC family toxin [Microthrixaceae bacterium]